MKPLFYLFSCLLIAGMGLFFYSTAAGAILADAGFLGLVALGYFEKPKNEKI